MRELVPAVFCFFVFLLLSAWLVRDQNLQELLSVRKCQSYHHVGWWEDRMRARSGVGRERKGSGWEGQERKLHLGICSESHGEPGRTLSQKVSPSDFYLKGIAQAAVQRAVMGEEDL